MFGSNFELNLDLTYRGGEKTPYKQPVKFWCDWYGPLFQTSVAPRIAQPFLYQHDDYSGMMLAKRSPEVTIQKELFFLTKVSLYQPSAEIL